MSVLHINEFGGILPSVQKRRLPGSSAQEAHNLDLRFGDFRPLRGPGAAVAAVAAGTKSLFRTPSGVWLSSTEDVNYVNGQINDAGFERVYLTGRAAYPEAWQGGAYRRLGVPAPTAAPDADLVVSDEFTTDEADEEVARLAGEIATLAQANDSATPRGAAPTPGAPANLAGLDPFREDVVWHFPMSTNFSDVGPRAVVPGVHGSASISAATDGPFAAASKYGIFTFGTDHGLSVPDIETSMAWTLSARIRLPNDLTAVTIHSQGFEDSISKIRLETGATDHILARMGYNATFRSTKRIVKDGGAVILPANTWGRLVICSDGAGMGVGRLTFWMNGVRFGSADWAKELQVSKICENMSGNVADIQLTNIARYPAGADFAPGTTPLPITGLDPDAAGIGYWLVHGTATSPALPTTESRDYAYLARMTATDTGYAMYNANEAYLQDASLGGRIVTHGGSSWWAVPARRIRAAGLDLNTAAFTTALQGLQNTEDPPGQLLDNDVIDDIVADVDALYEGAASPSLGLTEDLEAAQLALLQLIASYGASNTEASSKAAGFATAVRRVTAASDALSAFYADIDDEVRQLVSTKYGADVEAALPTQVQREVETRSYLFTWVSDRGEESGVSPASVLLELDGNDSVTVTVPAPPVDRFIVGWRLYRSSTTNSGAAWQLIADKNAANAVIEDGEFNYFDADVLTYSDSLTQGELQEPCPTITWAEPPEDLIGLVGLPNGIMAGFFGKTLCFCEPYEGHAWPVEYQQPLEFNIVGLGVFGQTLVVLTEGHPYYASGADSASMSLQKMESTQACASKRTIASMEGGVVYASPDGLCLAGPQGVELMTQGAFDRDDWQALDLPNCFGAFAEGVYHLFVPEPAP